MQHPAFGAHLQLGMTRNRPNASFPRQSLDSEIRRLKDELWMARRDIVELMPEDLRDILMSYYSCGTEDLARSWRRNAVERLVDLAEAKSPEEMGDSSSLSERALCPLCGEGSQNPYGVRGFAIPDGLTRHLEGSHNSQQCRVFSAAWHLAESVI